MNEMHRFNQREKNKRINNKRADIDISNLRLISQDEKWVGLEKKFITNVVKVNTFIFKVVTYFDASFSFIFIYL